MFIDIVRILPSCIVKMFEFRGKIFFRSECGDAVDVKRPVEVLFDEVRTSLDKIFDPFDVCVGYS